MHDESGFAFCSSKAHTTLNNSHLIGFRVCGRLIFSQSAPQFVVQKFCILKRFKRQIRTVFEINLTHFINNTLQEVKLRFTNALYKCYPYFLL